MLKITFKYRDEMSKWQWREQTCIVESVRECIEIYGLGTTCEYEILGIEQM